MASGNQSIQEVEYSFPYHHIPHIDKNGFSQIRHLPWGYEYMAYLYFVIDLLKKIDFKNLLDVGCGDGKFLSELNRNFPQKTFTGIDTSERAVRLAQVIVNNNVNFLIDDISLAKTTLGKYDVVTTIEVFEHIHPTKHAQNFIKSIWNHLNDNGIFILTVPSVNAPLIKKHYRHFNAELLKKELGPYFEIEKIYYINKRSAASSILKKFFGNRYFLLNHKKTLNTLFNFYKTHFLKADEKSCGRICVVARKKD